MNSIHTVHSAAACMAAAAALTMATFAPPVEAGTSCSGVEIRVRNDKSIAIKVLKVRYQVAPNGTWHTEDLNNGVLKRNGFEQTWMNQTLGSAPEGSKLNFKVVFQNDLGGGWSDDKEMFFDKSDKTCTDGKDYFMIVK
ncbi:MAG: hypothetical protein U1F25_21270 [Rubrivivax sp.]